MRHWPSHCLHSLICEMRGLDWILSLFQILWEWMGKLFRVGDRFSLAVEIWLSEFTIPSAFPFGSPPHPRPKCCLLKGTRAVWVWYIFSGYVCPSKTKLFKEGNIGWRIVHFRADHLGTSSLSALIYRLAARGQRGQITRPGVRCQSWTQLQFASFWSAVRHSGLSADETLINEKTLGDINFTLGQYKMFIAISWYTKLEFRCFFRLREGCGSGFGSGWGNVLASLCANQTTHLLVWTLVSSSVKWRW